MLSEKGVLEAVRRHLEEGGDNWTEGHSGNLNVTWIPLLEGEIVRSIETREERKHFHAGPKNLSEHPTYTSLAHHAIAPPRDPAVASTLTLVRKGSVQQKSCDCGNGLRACPRCSGRGELDCAAATSCTGCHGIDACLRCEGTGHRSKTVPAHLGSQGDDRVVCRKCGATDAACAVCRGRGHVTCPICTGTGTRTCPDCGGLGTTPHTRCNGTGTTVTWVEGVIQREPTVEKLSWPTTGLPFLARQHARERSNWRKANLVGDSPVPDDIDPDHHRLLQLRLAPRDNEIARQATFRYLLLARVVIPHHRHRVYYVFPGQDSPQVLILPSLRRTWQIATVAIGILAVLAIVSRLAT